MVAQIDEEELAVVALPVNPAGEAGLGAGRMKAQRAASGGAIICMMAPNGRDARRFVKRAAETTGQRSENWLCFVIFRLVPRRRRINAFSVHPRYVGCFDAGLGPGQGWPGPRSDDRARSPLRASAAAAQGCALNRA